MLDEADDIVVLEVRKNTDLLADIAELGRLAVNLELLVDFNCKALLVICLISSEMHRPVRALTKLSQQLVLPKEVLFGFADRFR